MLGQGCWDKDVGTRVFAVQTRHKDAVGTRMYEDVQSGYKNV